MTTLVAIVALTALAGDLASGLACAAGLRPSDVAITLVAFGLSLPGALAARMATTIEHDADASLMYIMCSISAGVFLGLGVPWVVGAVYWAHLAPPQSRAEWHARYQAEPWYVAGMPVGFAVPTAELELSLAIFAGCAFACVALLHARRLVVGVELGGSNCSKYISIALLICLWLLFLGLSLTGDDLVQLQAVLPSVLHIAWPKSPTYVGGQCSPLRAQLNGEKVPQWCGSRDGGHAHVLRDWVR